jgi:hypothetical protein
MFQKTSAKQKQPQATTRWSDRILRSSARFDTAQTRRKPCVCGGTCPKCRRNANSAARPLGERELPPLRILDERRTAAGPVEDVEDELEDLSGPPIQCSACREDAGPAGRKPEEDGWFTAATAKDGMVPSPPREDGWWTGNWYTGSNTIICDGSGSLTIHEATNYPHGVQECTRLHEGQHRTDWYARYGNDICKGRAKGDLPYFDPPGKEAYADFRKTSECAAWKVGRDCRNEKLSACGDDACKTAVQKHVDWANNRVKHYCGT